ncbi:hypothetical protein FLAG1_09466 [Fusarium langsethiae]|uniref:Uncharacterized protein n=1 Tax=Fusarium langsethiae TaxID=179993 RepID=A0A0N0V5E4_FUSLA|nr:hypothetical protein FLAG1_09466 [Fusarium langsethiae]
MFFFFTLIAFVFPIATPAELLPRKVVDLTIEAGNLVGTGVIEFKSPIQNTDVATKTALTCSDTSYVATGTYQTGPTTAAINEETSFLSTSPTLTPSQPFPLVPTTHQYFPNVSTGPTPTPTTTVPIVSGAIALHHVAHTSFLSLVAIGFYLFVF